VLRRYTRFLAGVSVNWIGKLGIVLTTSSFASLLLLEGLRLVGAVRSAYGGLITYLFLPSVFVAGLVLLPIAWRKYRRQTGKPTQELLGSRFTEEEVAPQFFGSRLLRTVAALTLLNIAFLVGASARALHFMDGASFCGTACHKVMGPEWATYQESSHAHVKCVSCHVGEGVGALLDSKLNGAWQMVSATFDLYHRPIPTPVHQLRPARETCEKCHWPEKFHGSSLQTRVRYAQDEDTTPRYTTLNMKVDLGPSAGASGIHWHVSRENEVRYASVDGQRNEMIWVEARRPDGTYSRYRNTSLHGGAPTGSSVRAMDCVDCHNRATHIFERPERAMDRRIRSGRLDRTLPYLKREGLRAITTRYPSLTSAMSGIETHLQRFYQAQYPRTAWTRASDIERAVSALQAAYRRNVHPRMAVTWGSYPNHLHHDTGRGCFRCHNAEMQDSEGRSVSQDCTLCHSILAYEAPTPFEYLGAPREHDPERGMHEYLGDEFRRSGR